MMCENMAGSRNTSSKTGKRLLEELQQKASELSTILASEGAVSAAAAPPNQAGPSSSSSRHMPSFRNQFMSSSNPFRGKGKGKGKSVVKGPFMRDIILLTGPDVNTVPRQAKRVWLMENGFVISGFQLQKEWSECIVEVSLREAFEEKIPAGVDFEILMPVHSTLVRPTLAPGQVLNGVMVHRIFKEKPIYIRPVKEICDVSISRTKRSLETSNEDEERVETPKAQVTFWLFVCPFK